MANSNPPSAPTSTPPAADPNALVRSFQDLLSLLTRDSVTHQPNVEGEEIIVPTQMGELASALVLRWRTADGALQFIQPLPIEVPIEQLANMESAINRLNFGMAFAGFALSHEARRVLYRLTLPLFVRGGLLPQEIKAYFSIAVKTASDSLPVLKRVASGATTPDKVVAEVQRYMAGGKPGAANPSATYED